MKIVYVTTSHVPSRIANSIHVMNICSSLAQMGHEVTLLLPRRGGEELDNIFSFYGLEQNFNIERLYYPNFKGKSIYFTLAVYKALKRLKPNLVVGRFINGCAIAAKIGIPTVFDSHGPIWDDSKWAAWIFRKMIQYKAFKKMTVNSNALKKIYLRSDIFENTTFNTQNLIVAHNGANQYDLAHYAPLQNNNDSLRVGYFGHLYAGRGIEIIVELAKRITKLDFYIVGGEEADISFWKSKVNLKNLHFIGYIPFAEVYKYRNTCDILLAPYKSVVSPEGGVGDQSPYMNPIKILEYMSSRKAIIVSDLLTTREVLDDSNSLLVDCENVDEWEKALWRLVKEPSLRERLADKAYTDFVNKFTWKIRAEKLISDVEQN